MNNGTAIAKSRAVKRNPLVSPVCGTCGGGSVGGVEGSVGGGSVDGVVGSVGGGSGFFVLMIS